MHAYIIEGDSTTDREQKLADILNQSQIQPIDQRKLEKDEEKQSIGIKEVQQFLASTNVKPIASDYLAIIINESHLLTEESQQTLLKTLEEPGQHIHFYLLTTQADALLGTIQSRCQIISVHPKISTDDNSPLITTLVQSKSRGDLLQFAETIAGDRQAALFWIDTQLTTIGAALLRVTTTQAQRLQMTKAAKILLKAKDHLLANVGYQMELDVALLKMKALISE